MIATSAKSQNWEKKKKKKKKKRTLIRIDYFIKKVRIINGGTIIHIPNRPHLKGGSLINELF
jgi:hypothetical protein